MNRKIIVNVDASTFPKSRRPSGFGKLSKRQSVHIPSILLHTALWTRSPLIQGLQLSDYWAWLRYGPAIDDTPDLRLRGEWNDVDPHQKTILSDELGVGITTYLLADTLGYVGFVDTHYVVRTGTLASVRLTKSSKRGPDKAPDYIAMTGRGEFVALECKGTQSSVQALIKAMTAGIDQKQNASGTGKTVLKLGLVAGLFVPQKLNPESATVLFWDPTWKDMNAVLDDMSLDTLRGWFRRGAIANQLALAGAPTAAKEIAAQAEGRLSRTAKRELEPLTEPQIVLDTSELRKVSLGVPKASLSAWIDHRMVFSLLRGLEPSSGVPPVGDWQHEETKGSCFMRTPDGFCFNLSMDESNTMEPQVASE